MSQDASLFRVLKGTINKNKSLETDFKQQLHPLNQRARNGEAMWQYRSYGSCYISSRQRNRMQHFVTTPSYTDFAISSGKNISDNVRS